MGEIASASVEQHTGIEQVNQAGMQMDGVTQQNAALVEEASSAAQSMAAQSGTLRELVSTFRLLAHVVGLASLPERTTVAASRPMLKTRKTAQRRTDAPVVSGDSNPAWQSF